MIKTYRAPYIILLLLVASLQFLTLFFSSSSYSNSNLFWIAINVSLFILIVIIVWSFSINLKRNENHIHALLNSLDDMILICNDKGKIQYSNHLLKNILSKPANKFPTIYSKEWDEYILMETTSGERIPVEQRPFVRILRGESVVNEEVKLSIVGSSSDCILLVTGKSLHNSHGKTIGAILIMKDITMLKEEEQHRIRLAKILEATSDYVGTADKDGRAVYINKGGLKLVGRDSFANVHLSEFHPSSANEIIVKEGIPTAISKGIWQGETALINHLGQTIPVSQVILSHKLDNGEVEFLSTIARDISDIKEAEAKILHMAMHDDLTGLLNRRGFKELATKRLNELQQPAAVLYFDLDGFKEVNDLHGHQAGDSLLQQVGERVATIINDDDLFSRQGGDEFVLLLTGMNIEKTKNKVKELQRLFLTPVIVEGHEINIAMSIGISIYPTDDNTIESLMKKADHAMYFSKRSGKNVVSFYHEINL